MRNILITVMMLVVVVVMFTGIINGEDGVKQQIQQQGTNASEEIGSITITE